MKRFACRKPREPTRARGHTIDLDDLDPDAFLNAMIASFEGDEMPLKTTILSLLQTRQ